MKDKSSYPVPNNLSGIPMEMVWMVWELIKMLYEFLLAIIRLPMRFLK